MKDALKGRTLIALINNAGVAWPAPFLHQSVTDFQKIITTNLIGTFMVTQVKNVKSALSFPGRSTFLSLLPRYMHVLCPQEILLENLISGRCISGDYSCSRHKHHVILRAEKVEWQIQNNLCRLIKSTSSH